MNSIHYARVAICALLASLAVAGSEVQEKRTLQKSFDLGRASNDRFLDVDNFEGSIRVTGYDGQEIQLSVEETLEADSPEKAQAARRELSLEMTQTNHTVRCYADGPFRCKNGSTNFRGWEHCGYKIRYDFDIRIPRRTALRLKNVNGEDIGVEKTEAKFEIENINGGIRMADISGSGRAYALNGKVRVQFRENPDANCYFGSLNGNVEITFRPRLSANILLKTFNGKVYSDYPVSALPPGMPAKTARAGKFVYKSNDFYGVRIGDGGPEFKFDAFNGDIRILSQEQ